MIPPSLSFEDEAIHIFNCIRIQSTGRLELPPNFLHVHHSDVNIATEYNNLLDEFVRGKELYFLAICISADDEDVCIGIKPLVKQIVDGLFYICMDFVFDFLLVEVIA